MQATDMKRGTVAETQDNPSFSIGIHSGLTLGGSRHTLDRDPVARTILAVLDTRRGGGVPTVIIDLAQRDGAQIVIYDLSSGSLWTTPYEPDDGGERFRNRVLSAGQLRYLGQHATAQAVEEVNRAGVAAGAYLASLPQAGDLCQLVQQERIDLVVALGPHQSKVVQNIQRVRSCGATLVERDPDGELAASSAFVSERA